VSACLHCNQEVNKAYFDENDSISTGPFCCQGCMAIFNVIKFKGLSEYYEIKKNISALRNRAPGEIISSKFSYLDDPDFQKVYSYKNSNSLETMEFYLEGIHCLACLWIIEKLPTFVEGVANSKLNMAKSVATVTITPEGRFASVARELASIGYKPHPLKINQTSNDLKIKEERSLLLKIGIAGAAAGNIMLYAVSIYAGAPAFYEKLFNSLTVIFALPVLTYCAYPFYRNSFVALKNRSLSIDVPISMALIMGTVMGFYNLFTGVHENYFDSLTALVFLLLLSRYFLKSIQEKGLSTTDLHYFYQGESILKMDATHTTSTEIHPKFIKIGDVLKILPNTIVPADAVIIQGESYLNNSLLTGESKLQKVTMGHHIFSGTLNISNELIISVEKINRETRLGQILKNIEDGWIHKSKIVEITNITARYFVLVVFTLAFILFFRELYNGSLENALERSLTLLIVTCPCALAIATPLTLTRTLSKSAEKGIIIKDDLVIEKLSLAKNVFIDKTGTLTQNSLQVVDFQTLAKPKINLVDIIYNLESKSSHPIARSLREYVKNDYTQTLSVDDYQEVAGIGVNGKIKGSHYEIRNYEIFEDQKVIAKFRVDDPLRADAKVAIEELRKMNLNIKILSGDNPTYVSEIAQKLSLKENEYTSSLTPEEKNNFILKSHNTVMIGDGANDSIALSSADTGIAVFGAMDIALRAADVYMNLPGLKQVVGLIVISKETMKVIYRNLILSLFYNSISVVLAFTGHISPLSAAIIMPLSSLSVLISTLIGTKKLRSEWK
jgi:P-type E1-E2 ATPase